MIFSRMLAGVDQSMRRSTRKPRLNQDEKRWTKSASTAARSSRWSIASISFSRMRTSAFVPARLGGAVQLRRGGIGRRVAPRVDGARDPLRVGTEAVSKRLEEGDTRP